MAFIEIRLLVVKELFQNRIWKSRLSAFSNLTPYPPKCTYLRKFFQPGAYQLWISLYMKPLVYLQRRLLKSHPFVVKRDRSKDDICRVGLVQHLPTDKISSTALAIIFRRLFHLIFPIAFFQYALAHAVRACYHRSAIHQKPPNALLCPAQLDSTVPLISAG